MLFDGGSDRSQHLPVESVARRTIVFDPANVALAMESEKTIVLSHLRILPWIHTVRPFNHLTHPQLPTMASLRDLVGDREGLEHQAATGVGDGAVCRCAAWVTSSTARRYLGWRPPRRWRRSTRRHAGGITSAGSHGQRCARPW